MGVRVMMRTGRFVSAGWYLVAALIVCAAASFLVEPSARAQQEDLDERVHGKERELEKLRKAIAEQRRKIREVEEKEKDVSGYLEKLKREESMTRDLLDGLAEKEAMLGEQVRGVRGELETNEMVYRHRLSVLATRLREMYKEGPRRMWQELLSARDFADLLQRYKFLSLIAERDAALVSAVRDKKAEIERQEAELTELLQEVSFARNEKESELERLRDNQAKREQTLADLKERKGGYRKKAEELARAEQQLQGLIDELEKRRLEQAKQWGDYGERDFLRLKGTMPPPVEGTVVRPFGRFKHPEFGTVTFNTGLDIESRAGSPVRAVARGKVEYASTLPGYGNCIIINHGGGYYSLYAHTSRIFVEQGDIVDSGHVIAETDAGGSGAGTPLHFEIRKSKKALDPGEWLTR
jgi:septal ring factor EnvC (AmiA/AmiB activator)